jgi:hypothetical protein
MTPYELSRELHRDLSPIAPRLATALNRALVDIGEGSVLVGLPNGMSAGDQATFDERESIALAGCRTRRHPGAHHPGAGSFGEPLLLAGDRG